MKTKAFLLVCFFSTCSSMLFAQSDSSFLNLAARGLYDHYDNHPTEKVYLHHDRDCYQPGDTIWFKAYVVTGSQHKLSAISGILYVELIGAKDSLLKRLTLPLSSGLTNGDFILPVDFMQSNCRIRAYTNWMRNEDASYFYDEQVMIGTLNGEELQTSSIAFSKPKKNSGTTTLSKPKIDLQFFPEGGNLVNGLRSKIAVKAINNAGWGEDISGAVVDDDNHEVAYFTTQHLGMGDFALIPEAGKNYKVKITIRDSSVYTFNLPAAIDEGFTLSANATQGDSLYIKVAANEKLFKKLQNTSFYVIAQQNGNICYTANAKLVSPVFTAAIPKNRFKTGICQITLFAASGEAINERVVFIQTHDQLKLNINVDSVAQPWHNFSLNLEAQNHSGKTAVGSFSVAVINDELAGSDVRPEETIFTNLLLKSDLKGYVEDPNYYFTNVNDKTRADLDLLMLTQGYRKLVWKQVLGDNDNQPSYAAEKSLSMEGKVMTPSGEAVANGKVSVTSLKDMAIIDTLTATDGSFKFANLALRDTAKLIIKARKPGNGKNVAIYIKQPDYPAINKIATSREGYSHNPIFDDHYANNKLESAMPDTGARKKLLRQVNIIGRKVHQPDRYNGYGTVFEYDVNLAQLKDYADLKDAIAHKIPGVSLDSRGHLKYDGAYLTVMINWLHRSGDDLNIYNLSDIESIRVIDATLTSGPVLMVTTHQFTGRDSIHIKLKEVKIQARKLEKDDKYNQYGTDAPYIISQQRIKNLGPNLSPGLASLIPAAIYADGGLIASTQKYPPVLLHIVLNDHEIVQTGGSENDNSVLMKQKGLTFHPDNINNYVGTDDVESIKILHGAYYKNLYGIHINPKNGDADDIVLITTKQYAGTLKPDNANLKEASLKATADTKYITTDLPTGLMIYPFKGYYKAREFYSPKFTAPQNGRSYDPRATIYWNPNVITDANGHAVFNYFNTGNKGSYRVVVEGIDADGNLGRVEYRYRLGD